jgi:hypothetical protein
MPGYAVSPMERIEVGSIEEGRLVMPGYVVSQRERKWVGDGDKRKALLCLVIQ